MTAPHPSFEDLVRGVRARLPVGVGETYFDGFLGRHGEQLRASWDLALQRVERLRAGCAVRVAETFGGGGLFALAWTAEGARLVDFVELNASACRTVTTNLRPAEPTDAWTWMPPPGLDVLSGGPPCQPWSRAGATLGPDDVRNAYPLIGRWLRSLEPDERPKVVVLENAATVLSKNRFRRYFKHTIVPEIETAGYELVFWRLNAADYGDPQMRLRVILVAWRRDGPWGERLRTPPPPSHGRPGTPPVLEGQVLPWVRGFDRLRSGCCGGYGQIDCENLGNLDRRCETCFGVMGELPPNFVRAQGADSRDLPPGEVDYLVRPKGSTGQPRYTAHRPSPFGGAQAFRPLDLSDRRVIGYLAAVPVANLARGVPYGLLTTDGGLAEVDVDTNDPEQVRAFVETLRRISVRQAARIMGVPQWYAFEGSERDQYRQVGNGIPLGMGRAVARHVIAALCPDGAPDALARQRWTGLWPLEKLDTCQGFAGITAYPGLPTGPDKQPDPLARPLLDAEALRRAQAAERWSSEALDAWGTELGLDSYQADAVLASWRPGAGDDEPPGFPDFEYFLSWLGGEDPELATRFADHYRQHAGEVHPRLAELAP